MVLDPNVHIQETKAADLRHPAGPAAARAGAAWSYLAEYRRRAGLED